MTTLATMVRLAREAAQLSQAELAKRIDVSQSLVAQLESGKVLRTSPKIAARLERVLGVSRQELAVAMGQVAPSTEFNLEAEVRRIAAIRDDEERAAALDSVPRHIREDLWKLALTEFHRRLSLTEPTDEGPGPA